MAELGLGLQGLMASPLLGPAGNVEFLGWWQLGLPARGSEGALMGALEESDRVSRRGAQRGSDD